MENKQLDYKTFIETKIPKISECGFNVEYSEMNPKLKDFQKFGVKRALKAGRFALFWDCGLGKSFAQLEWAFHVSKHTGKPVIILAPLVIVNQTLQEAAKFGYTVERYNPNSKCLIQIYNYDNLDKITNVEDFAGVVLDESSMIKNFMGKTKTLVMDLFQDTYYKLCCTATPSPNDVTELLNHCEFLQMGTRVQILSKYFINDTGDTGTWRLKGHAKSIFWLFVSQWALCLTKPSDIRFSDEGYILPELTYKTHIIQVERPQDYEKLFLETSVSAIEFNEALRATKTERCALAAEICNNSDKQRIVWCAHNDESKHLQNIINDSVEIVGSESAESKAKKINDFIAGKFKVLITKTKICGFGINFQNCYNQVFVSLDFSFEKLFQAVRRSWRFGQTQPVNIDLITTNTMQNIIASLEKKRLQFIEMTTELSKSTAALVEDKPLVQIQTEAKSDIQTNLFRMIHHACELASKEIETESIDLSIFSPPFSDLFTYSDNPQDMGNSTEEEFEKQFAFLAIELNRIMKSGRSVCVHVMDLPSFKFKDGEIGLKDFSGTIIRIMQEANFTYYNRTTIWKDPVVAMQRTKAMNLLFKQLNKDSAWSCPSNPDYVLFFRKKGDNKVPILPNISLDLWQQWASPVWMDINQSDTLQKESAREEEDERHISLLQLEVIKRLIHFKSNPNELVFSPFAGIGSEGVMALRNDRRFLGIELKESYFNQAVKNLQAEVIKKQQTVLF